MNSDLTRNYLNGTIPSEWASLPLVNVYAIIFLSLSCTYTWQLMLFTSPNQDVDLFLFLFYFWMETRNLSAIVIGKWKAQATLMTNQRAWAILFFFSIFFFWVEMHLT